MTKQQTRKVNNFKLTLLTSGIEHKAQAETVDDALAELGLSWNQIKAKGDVTIKRNGKEYSHFFPLPQLKRIFANRLTRQLWAKRLTMLFNEQ